METELDSNLFLERVDMIAHSGLPLNQLINVSARVIDRTITKAGTGTSLSHETADGQPKNTFSLAPAGNEQDKNAGHPGKHWQSMGLHLLKSLIWVV